jgi:hypothetical protein
MTGIMRIWRLQMAHSVTQHTDFTKAFFTVRMSRCVTVQVWMLVHLLQYERCGLHCAGFHEIHRQSTALCAGLWYRISPKSDNKCGKVHLCPSLSTALTARRIFTKPTLAPRHKYSESQKGVPEIRKVWQHMPLFWVQSLVACGNTCLYSEYSHW